MNNEIKNLLSKEIETLLPVQRFDPNLRDVHGSLCKEFAEKILKKFPADKEIIEHEGKLLIRKKSEEKEGLEKLIQDAGDFNFITHDMPTIAELLEDSIHPSWNKLINDKFLSIP